MAYTSFRLRLSNRSFDFIQGPGQRGDLYLGSQRQCLATSCGAAEGHGAGGEGGGWGGGGAGGW